VILQSRYDGKCKACWGTYSIGEAIAWDPDTRKAYHPECAPDGVADEAPARPREKRPRAQAYTPAATKDKAHEALLAWFLAGEQVIFCRSGQVIGPELEKAWDRYQKAKAIVLRTTTLDTESRAAARLAMQEVIKLIF
jgi:hypothetical protein